MTEMRTRTRIGLAAMSAVALATVSLLVTPAGETVASFVDREYSQGVFTSGKWNVQGNATVDVTETSTGWSDHFTAAGAAIFQPTVSTVVPGSTRSYSRFGLRMASGSSRGATVTIPQGAESPAGRADKFRMRVVRSSSSTCNEGSFASGATFVVGSATPTYGNMLSSPITTGDVNKVALSPGSPISNPGTAVYLCYEFSLPIPIPSGLSNGDTAAVRWTFNAVSS